MCVHFHCEFAFEYTHWITQHQQQQRRIHTHRYIDANNTICIHTCSSSYTHRIFFLSSKIWMSECVCANGTILLYIHNSLRLSIFYGMVVCVCVLLCMNWVRMRRNAINEWGEMKGSSLVPLSWLPTAVLNIFCK